jgi:hypothetical protein
MVLERNADLLNLLITHAHTTTEANAAPIPEGVLQQCNHGVRINLDIKTLLWYLCNVKLHST